jgi:hypothetical protein
VKGYNTKNKTEIAYPNIRSAILPVLHGPEIPIPSRPENLDLFSPVSDSEISGSEKSDSDFQVETTAKELELFPQSELSDLVRELGLPKDLAEILESRLCEKNMVGAGTSYYWYRHREEEIIPYFSQEGPPVSCNNIPELAHRLGLSDTTLVHGGCSSIPLRKV